MVKLPALSEDAEDLDYDDNGLASRSLATFNPLSAAQSIREERRKRREEKRRELEDDPFAGLDLSKRLSWYDRRKERLARKAATKAKAQAIFNDQKLRELELQAMETEEKRTWDMVELPERNLRRMKKAEVDRVQDEKVASRKRAMEEANQKEMGFTSLNGFIKDFSRWRNSPALYHTFTGHRGAVLSLRVSKSNEFVVTCSEDQTVKLWDLSTMRCFRTYEGHGKAVRDCDVSPNLRKKSKKSGDSGKKKGAVALLLGEEEDVKNTGLVVSCSTDKTVRVWDALQTNCRKVIRGHTDVVYCCCFNPTGDRIASCSADRTLRLWDAYEGHLIYMFDGHHESACLWCVFSHSGRYMASCSDFGERKIRLYSPNMPIMTKKQSIGFRVLWETSGVIRKFTIETDAKRSFLSDVEASQREVEAEAEADEINQGESESDEDSDLDEDEKKAKKDAAKERELERVALDTADCTQLHGFSLSVNSVDRFGRPSQVKEFYRGVDLDISLRGVDKFDRFTLSVNRKVSQFESFSADSGRRVGVFDKQAETIGTRLACDGSVIASRSSMHAINSLSVKWRAPRVNVNDSEKIGPVVVRAAVRRSVESMGPDDEDVGLVQLCFTLSEIDPPSKGSVLSEMSQRVNREERQFQFDVVANHQLFIDFLRNKDIASAATMLSTKCYASFNGTTELNGLSLHSPEVVMALLRELMVEGSVIVKDASLVMNGVSSNAVDRQKISERDLLVDPIEESEESEEGPAGLALKAEKSLTVKDGDGTTQSEQSPSKRSERLPSSHAPPGSIEALTQGSISISTLEKVNKARVRRAGATVKQRALWELSSIIAIKRKRLAVADELRMERVNHTHSTPAFVSMPTEQVTEGSIVSRGMFGFGLSRFKLKLPDIYPSTALPYDEDAINAREAKKRMQAQSTQQESSSERGKMSKEEVQAWVSGMVDLMHEEDEYHKQQSMKRRDARHTLPGLEQFNGQLATGSQVREYSQTMSGDWKSYMLPYDRRRERDELNRLKQSHSMTELANEQDQHQPQLGDDYDRSRRRNAFGVLPGFHVKKEKEKMIDEEVQASIADGGLIRTFFIPTKGGVKYEVHHNSINQIAFSFDDVRLASCSTDGKIHLFDVLSGRLVNTLSGAHKHAVMTIAFSPDSQRLLSSGLDNVLVLWNVSSGESLRQFHGHDDGEGSVSGMVSCSLDKTLKLWYLTPQPPSPPEKPIVAHVAQISMIVTWRAPPAFNAEMTAYHLEYRVGIRQAFSNRITTGGDEYRRTVTGLTPGTPYQFRVRAVNRMGVGHWSDPSAQTITKIDVPEALERPEVMEVGLYSLGIQWFAPTATVEGTAINRFVVQVTGAGFTPNDQVQQTVAWSESCSAFTLFEQRRTVKESVGLSDEIEDESKRIAREQRMRRQQQMLDREKEKKDLEAVKHRQLSLEAGEIVSVKKKKKKRSKQSSELAPASSSGVKNMVPHYLVYEGLQPGFMYRFRVAGVSSVGMGKWSQFSFSKATASTKPAQPDPPTVTDVQLTGITVEWRPANENGAAISSFSLKILTGDHPLLHTNSIQVESHAAVLRFNAHTCCHSFTDLSPGTSYRFQVRAGNQHGLGEWSEPTALIDTLTTAPLTPHPPKFTHSGLDYIALTLSLPFDNGAPIHSILLQRREISMYSRASWGSDVTLRLKEDALSASTINRIFQKTDLETVRAAPSGVVEVTDEAVVVCVASLKAGCTYDFRVAVQNRDGLSDFSVGSKRFRTAAPLVPQRVKAVKVEEVFPTAVGLSWCHPHDNGAAVTTYTIDCERLKKGKYARDSDTDECFTVEVASRPTDKRVSGLIEENTYRFRIRANSAVGAGAASEWTQPVHCSEGAGGEPLLV